MADPFFKINFTRHKMSEAKYKMNIFRITMSVFIIMWAYVLSCLGSGETMTIEQANDVFFIIFSLFCFTKFVTVFTHIILTNKIIKKSLNLVRQTYPFLVKMSILYGIILLMATTIGRSLYGGDINSQQIGEYQSQTGLKIKQNYHYLHFNDTFSGMLTLMVLLMQNNWVFVTEILFFSQKSQVKVYYTVIFIIVYQFLAAFILTSLFFGVISRLIMFVFEQEFDFENIEKLKKKKKTDEAVTDESNISLEKDDEEDD